MKSNGRVIRHFVVGAVLLAIMLALAPAPRSAVACNPTLAPPGYIPPTPVPIGTIVATAHKDAQIIFEGTVTNWGNGTVAVKIDRYFKGYGLAVVQVGGYFTGCGDPFRAHGIFFVNGDATKAQVLQYRDWLESDDSAVRTLSDLSGQPPKTPVSYGDTEPHPNNQDSASTTAPTTTATSNGAFLIAAIIILAAVFIGLRRQR
jgi:hypothetical protein